MSDLFRFAQLQPYALSGAGAVRGATTITLKSMTDSDGTALTMSGTFGDIGFGTLQPGLGGQEEQICFTGLTNNSNGTVTLTGVKNVTFTYPYTQTSGLLKTHPGSSTFVISNTAGFYDKMTSKSDDETITGTWTFTAVPGSTAAPLGGDDLTNKTYVDALVNGGDVSTNALIVAGTAGETVAAGTPVYLKAADGLWWKAIGTTAATVNGVELGIAQGAGTAGVAISGGVLLRGLDSNQSGGAAGSIGYISDTSTIATSAGTVSRAIGNFITATTFNFDPYQTSFPTADEKAAMAGGGSYGTPSTSNKFLTEDVIGDTTVFPNPVVRTYLAAASPATWTKPAGLKYITVELQATGGDGAASPATGDEAGAGGGSGGYTKKLVVPASLGSTETVTISDASGGTTSFGSHCSAVGGTDASGETQGTGGTATGGDINITGGIGEIPNDASNNDTTAAVAWSGRGAGSILGIGGAQKYSASGGLAGNAATGYGAGGGGGIGQSGNPTAGGAGSPAIVIVTEYYA